MQKSKPSKSQAEKLKELELSGLVDFTQQHARSVADQQDVGVVVGWAATTNAEVCCGLLSHSIST